jgi:hypothetical protein
MCDSRFQPTLRQDAGKLYFCVFWMAPLPPGTTRNPYHDFATGRKILVRESPQRSTGGKTNSFRWVKFAVRVLTTYGCLVSPMRLGVS